MESSSDTKLEATKLAFDYLKQLATLDTAAILIMVSFLEKLFAKPIGRFWVVAAFCSFMISLLGVLVHHSVLLFVVENKRQILSPRLASVVVVASVGGLFFGLLALAIFGILNFT